MEKFGMSFGGGPSKKDLMDTIESQKKQLVQYQTRFKDVVRAYKSLLKEKEALEASLKVLTVSQEVDLGQQCDDGGGGSFSGAGTASVTSDLPDDRGSLHSEDSLDTAASADMATSDSPGGEQGVEEENGGTHGEAGARGPSLLQRPEVDPSGSESGVSSSSSSSGPDQHQAPTPPLPPVANAAAVAEATDRRVLQLRSQLTTLTSSLATVTQEKSRMEASFQADKRSLKQELEEVQGRLDEARRLHDAELQALQDQLAESKARVITQQHEREQEQGDHALMLRELQKLLQEERDLRQDGELQLEEAQATLRDALRAAEQGAGNAARLKEAAEEREEMRRSLRAAEAERAKPNPQVEELRRELVEVKSHYQQLLQQESRKAALAEEHAREQAQAEEGRVASLEERVSELSELLGACEKARQRDQQSGQRLRERILQLDTENKTLAIAATSSSGRAPADLGLDEAHLDVNVLRDKMERVKKLLLLASQRNHEQALEIEKLVETQAEPGGGGGGGGGGGSTDGEKATVLYYQQELRQLKEEFERYKLRAQAALKNKSTRDGCQARELEEAREQLAQLKDKYISLRIHGDEAAAEHRRALEERQQSAAALQQGHRLDLERLEAQHRDSLLRLEGELHKQRDRTMALLAEKDRELERLRAAAAASHRGRSDGDRDGGDQASDDGGSPAGDPAPWDESDTIAQALGLAGHNEPTLLLYAEQLARKEVEAAALRRQKRCLEEEVRRLQGELVASRERHGEEAAALRAQLDKLLRDQGRESANLEYLKNVMLKFLTLQDGSGRQQTLAAILAVLHFSPQEKQAVLRLQTQAWWQSVKR